MTKQVNSLTPEQESLFSVYRDKWLKIGLSTEPVDFETAKKAVAAVYQNVGLNVPSTILMIPSPDKMIEVLKKYSVKKTDRIDSLIYGAHDASWLSTYDFYMNVVGVQGLEKIVPLIELAKCSDWVNVFDNLAIIHDRPESIRMDDEKRLHCEDGPAIRYRDGFSLYAWHGIRIPQEWIENKNNLNPEIALTWENVEQRRCAAEIIGWVKVLDKLDARVINADPDPEIGVLLEVNIPDVGHEKFLKVQCGTGRIFALPVPPEMKTAIEAQAWTWGMSETDFEIPEIRT